MCMVLHGDPNDYHPETSTTAAKGELLARAAADRRNAFGGARPHNHRSRAMAEQFVCSADFLHLHPPIFRRRPLLGENTRISPLRPFPRKRLGPRTSTPIFPEVLPTLAWARRPLRWVTRPARSGGPGRTASRWQVAGTLVARACCSLFRLGVTGGGLAAQRLLRSSATQPPPGADVGSWHHTSHRSQTAQLSVRLGAEPPMGIAEVSFEPDLRHTLSCAGAWEVATPLPRVVYKTRCVSAVGASSLRLGAAKG